MHRIHRRDAVETNGTSVGQIRLDREAPDYTRECQRQETCFKIPVQRDARGVAIERKGLRPASEEKGDFTSAYFKLGGLLEQYPNSNMSVRFHEHARQKKPFSLL